MIINYTEDFAREVKRLAKKHRSLRNDLEKFQKDLLNCPSLGVNIAPNLYKCRLAITSKGKGKSGGARIITYVLLMKEQIFLISIYDKSELENLSIEAIIERIENAGLPLIDEVENNEILE
jgi:mRNA-degrading endonuclease RelE of RelBE toxin-antitoxin system